MATDQLHRKFVVDDAEDEWAHGDGFDLIHSRHLIPAIKDADKLAKQAFE